LALGLLGALRIELDGQPLRRFDSDLVRALLVYLVVEARQAHRRESLLGLIWPKHPQENARHSLSQAIYNLHSILGDRQAAQPYLLSYTQTIAFNPQSDYQLDVEVFNRLLEVCESHAHPRLVACEACLERLQEAAALYRGAFLQDFALVESLAFEEWSAVLRERMQRRALKALHQLAGCLAERGELEPALGYAWRQVELEPLWEAGQRQAIYLLVASGQRSAALMQFESFRHMLWQELSVEPEPETQELANRLRQEQAVLSPGEMARVSHGRVFHFPTPLTPLVGREAELDGLCQALRDPTCRLLTVSGPGGSGKTRLALEAGRKLAQEFSAGVTLVELISVVSPQSIPAALGEALGLGFQPARPPVAQIIEYLREKQMLLVLDGFEHLAGGAVLVGELLCACPQVKALVTSRHPLKLQGERLYPLGGLRCPSSDGAEPVRNYEAVALFLQVAQRARPGYQPGVAELQEIARLCRLVEGMPLGILLAAGWIELFNPGEIVAQVEQSYAFLAAEWDDLPERQRSLRATFEYSWQLLTRGEQEFLAGLSVFRGSFTASAAHAVTGADAQRCAPWRRSRSCAGSYPGVSSCTRCCDNLPRRSWNNRQR
jgi:DNA-binding SARP family transcriptional activator